MASDERVYFDDPALGVTISSSRAIFDSAAFSIPDLQSVEIGMVAYPFRVALAALLALVGVALGIVSAVRFFNGDLPHALLWLASSAAAFIAMWLLSLFSRPRHVLTVSTTNGDVQTLVSRDQSKVHAVAAAIAKAIADRRTAGT